MPRTDRALPVLSAPRIEPHADEPIAVDRAASMRDLFAMKITDTIDIEELDSVLERSDAKLAAWEVHALYLGAQASTAFGLGPHHLLDRIYDEDMMLGGDIEEANENLQVLMGYWNTLLTRKEEYGEVELSLFTLSDPPTIDEIVALAQRRSLEMMWFVRGVDAGGDDPIEFGEEGQGCLRRMAEGSAFCIKFDEALSAKSDQPADELRKSQVSLEQLTLAFEREIMELSVISDAIRVEAMATLREMEGQETDDGVPIARRMEVGRNDLCPCGSAKKYKKCCGGPRTLQ